MANSLNGLTLPLSVQSGSIVDATGKPIIHANRNSNETPLSPVGRDAIIYLACTLLNEAFQYDKADQILKQYDY